MKPLTDNMKRMLAVLAEWGNARKYNLNTLHGLQSRGLVVIKGTVMGYSTVHLTHSAKLTDAGRKLAAELAAEKGDAR